MEGRTQLIIGGVEVVLPQNFATTVKRENSFFTKNGEYTYDCTLRLDNQTNRELYGFLQRLNKKEAVQSKRSAVLMADGRVYCRGTEVITGWTDEEVTVQVVSGNSELNYFIGNDLKIEWLDLGSVNTSDAVDPSAVYPDRDYCQPTIMTNERAYNNYNGSAVIAGRRLPNGMGSLVRYMPYLCGFLRRLMTALGYTLVTNQLETTMFKYLFIVHTELTNEYAKMMPGWTVKDFLQEVENLCGVVFVTDNLRKTVDILQKSIYYQNARQYPLQNVIDEYEMNIDEENGDAEFTSSDVDYDLHDHLWTKFMALPDGFAESVETMEFESLDAIRAASGVGGKLLKDTSTGRLYIQTTRTYYQRQGQFGGSSQQAEEPMTEDYIMEVNQFDRLDRADAQSKLEIKLPPAPITRAPNATGWPEVLDIRTSQDTSSGGGGDSCDSCDADEDASEMIRSFSKQESSEVNLYVAFHNGYRVVGGRPLPYTDAYHAAVYPPMSGTVSGWPVGSLRLQDIEAELYAGVYRIDTTHKVVFETYDPNMLDPRAIIVVRNRRWVVREIEETLTSSGRKPSWKVTCHPIEISDTAAESRWVLTKGVWDDGGAWLDDGRWND